MKKYVALLRGINVGGNNTMSMSELKKSFSSLGFTDIVTYINSGNVIFTTTLKSQKKIVTLIEDVIRADFELDIPVVVRDAMNITKICKSIPVRWTNDADQKTDVMFLWDTYARKDILKEIKINKDVDSVTYYDGAIIWHMEKKNSTKSRIHKIIGTKLYKNMTVRNINTVRKIKQLMQT